MTTKPRQRHSALPAIIPCSSFCSFFLVLCFFFFFVSSSTATSPSPFADWLPRHSQSEAGLFLLDHRSLAEGEVLLFRTKKSRHRAIAVMSAHQQHSLLRSPHHPMSSRFADALTFKDWLRRVYKEDKALKVSVRTSEVVRPVLQHLYATRAHFRAPIIVHANTFEGEGGAESSSGGGSPSSHHRPSSSSAHHHLRERPVDAVLFVDSVHSLLPDAVISLGWTQSSDFAAINRLDWARAFQLIGLLHGLADQPVMLNMRLNDAVHSAEVLEWLLGVERPHIYLVLKGNVDDFVDSESPLKRLASIGGSARTRLLFDVDEKWRSRIRRFAPGPELSTQRMLSVEPSRWVNWMFPSSSSVLSTSVLSPSGVAFLGWPNSLLLSTRPSASLPSRQSVTGRVLFLPKDPSSHALIPQRRSGMVLYLFDTDPDLLFAPRVPHSVQAFVGFDGRISLENNAPTSTLRANTFAKSSSAQLPQWPCYAFVILDRGWRVEMEVWTEKCASSTDEKLEEEEEDAEEGSRSGQGWVSQRTFLQLDTPIARNRRTRNVAIGKSGDGAIDFIVRALEHNGASSTISSLSLRLIMIALPSLISLTLISLILH